MYLYTRCTNTLKICPPGTDYRSYMEQHVPEDMLGIKQHRRKQSRASQTPVGFARVNCLNRFKRYT